MLRSVGSPIRLLASAADSSFTLSIEPLAMVAVGPGRRVAVGAGAGVSTRVAVAAGVIARVVLGGPAAPQPASRRARITAPMIGMIFRWVIFIVSPFTAALRSAVRLG